jgi:purine-binding chemotaxis protein CheW
VEVTPLPGAPDIVLGVAGLEHIQGVVKLDDGLVLIHDLDTFLSLHEVRTLNEAMERPT